MAAVFPFDPQLPASLARATTAQELDRLEREIARGIGAVKPARRAGGVVAFESPWPSEYAHVEPADPGEPDGMSPAQRELAQLCDAAILDRRRVARDHAPIEAALTKAQAAFGAALEETGLSPRAVALLQAWVDMTADTRALQQQIAMRRAELSGADRATSPETPLVAPGDPVAPLSAAEMGQALGLHEQSVRTRERAGELFAILRPGRKRGGEYPAFQAWPGIAGEPLAKTLAALASGQPVGMRAASTLAYTFFTSRTELLGGLTPIEVLLGRLTQARVLEAEVQALLGAPAAERLEAVVRAAQTAAAVDAA
jgi:hypothetical protein